MSLKKAFISLIIILPFVVFSQMPKKAYSYIDSLAKPQSTEKKIYYLLKLANITKNANFIESYKYAKQAIQLTEETRDFKGMVEAYNAIGDAYWFHADYGKAQSYYFKAYRINDSLNDQRGIAHSLFNIGWIICIQQKKYSEVDYFYRALNTVIPLKDTGSIGEVYNALGNMYNDKYSSTKDKPSFDSALKYYNAGMQLYANNGSAYKTGIYLTNIGELMSLAGDYKSAIYYGQMSSELFLKTQDSVGFELSQMNMGRYYVKTGEVDKGLDLLLQAYLYAIRTDNRDILVHVYESIYEAYKLKKNTEKALFFLEKFKSLNDSTQSEIYSSSIQDQQNSYELEKKEANIKELTQANEIQDLKAKQNRFVLLGGAVVLIVIIVIAYFLYKRNKEKHLINLQLHEQNTIISQKKHEIESSIQYAKGIQTSFFPEIEGLNKIFPESFIFYRPKDVVSGDFYWFHQVNDCFYCVAADCTGHGVPGALMSIVSVDKINQAIFEKKLTEPAEILKSLNIEIKNALKQHDDAAKQKDGLDIALIKINLKTLVLTYAAANRPLFIVNNTNLTEYKADKTAIAGFTPSHYQFSQTEIQLHKNDCIYIFSDGYADQFGGDEGKKFMTKNFKSLLNAVAGNDMKAQETAIVDAHYKWKGNYEQVDDILVIGLKI